MAEIEIHAAHGHDDDPLAKRIGILVGVIGIALAITTIASHREHTAAVIHRTEANDDWSYYQAKKIREHTSDVGAQIVRALAGEPARTEAAAAKFDAARAKYLSDAEEIQKGAKHHVEETEHAEYLALRFDIGEGFLELGLVLTSLYFLGRQRWFPVAGVVTAAAGLLVALSAVVP